MYVNIVVVEIPKKTKTKKAKKTPDAVNLIQPKIPNM